MRECRAASLGHDQSKKMMKSIKSCWNPSQPPLLHYSWCWHLWKLCLENFYSVTTLKSLFFFELQQTQAENVGIPWKLEELLLTCHVWQVFFSAAQQEWVSSVDSNRETKASDVKDLTSLVCVCVCGGVLVIFPTQKPVICFKGFFLFHAMMEMIQMRNFLKFPLAGYCMIL